MTRSPRTLRHLHPAPAAARRTGRGTCTSARHLAPARLRRRASDERISIDDFMKVELRVAKVLTAERVPKSKKL